jgi:SnoaL-like domain
MESGDAVAPEPVEHVGVVAVAQKRLRVSPDELGVEVGDDGDLVLAADRREHGSDPGIGECSVQIGRPVPGRGSYLAGCGVLDWHQQLSAIVNRYVEAWSQGNVDAIVDMLTDTATLAMPPTASWFRGLEAIAVFLRATALDGTRSWRLLPTSANAQLAMGAYARDPSGAYLPYGVAVLGLRGDKIDEITNFSDPAAPDRFGLPRHA